MMLQNEAATIKSSSETVFRLTVSRGLAAPRTREFHYGVPQDAYSVGSEADWVVRGPEVQPIHAYLYFDGEQLFVQCALSNRHLLVNGEKVGVAWAPVPEDGEIEIGSTLLTLSRVDDASEEPTAFVVLPPEAQPSAPAAPMAPAWSDSGDFATQMLGPEVTGRAAPVDDFDAEPTRMLPNGPVDDFDDFDAEATRMLPAEASAEPRRPPPVRAEFDAEETRMGPVAPAKPSQPSGPEASVVVAGSEREMGGKPELPGHERPTLMGELSPLSSSGETRFNALVPEEIAARQLQLPSASDAQIPQAAGQPPPKAPNSELKAKFEQLKERFLALNTARKVLYVCSPLIVVGFAYVNLADNDPPMQPTAPTIATGDVALTPPPSAASSTPAEVLIRPDKPPDPPAMPTGPVDAATPIAKPAAHKGRSAERLAADAYEAGRYPEALELFIELAKDPERDPQSVATFRDIIRILEMKIRQGPKETIEPPPLPKSIK